MARILLVGEATWLQTGYATYALQIARRLKAVGHEIGELACYGTPNDPRRAGSPWPAFFVTTRGDDYPSSALINSNAALGATAFEEAVVKFRPDVVISMRDPWQDSFIAYSPLRDYFRWVFMHPVDGEPQDEEWIAILNRADAILAYSQYGFDVLKKFPGLNLFGVASPGAEPDVFHPLDQKEARKALNISQDALVIGTVMRNQGRKLLPDLFETFEKFLLSAPAHIANRLYLYCHTAWPDVGWDIPKYLLRYNVAHRTLFTFACKKCDRASALLWQLPSGYCPFCASGELTTPGVAAGLPRAFMRPVYSSMDVFVQYSVCEGFGMPQVEAASCGVPVTSVDFTAMSSVASALDAQAISVERTFTELETGRVMALPKNDDLIAILNNLLLLPPAARRAIGSKQRDLAIKTFDYDLAGGIWHNAISKLSPPIKRYQDTARKLPPLQMPPDHLTNREWVDEAFQSALGISSAQAGFVAQRMTRDLSRTFCDTTFTPGRFAGFGPGGRLGGYERKHAWAQLCAERERVEFWEAQRS